MCHHIAAAHGGVPGHQPVVLHLVDNALEVLYLSHAQAAEPAGLACGLGIADRVLHLHGEFSVFAGIGAALAGIGPYGIGPGVIKGHVLFEHLGAVCGQAMLRRVALRGIGGSGIAAALRAPGDIEAHPVPAAVGNGDKVKAPALLYNALRGIGKPYRLRSRDRHRAGALFVARAVGVCKHCRARASRVHYGALFGAAVVDGIANSRHTVI